jgi:AhpC/TSA family
LHNELADQGFTVVAVALDEAEAAREWIEAASPTYPCVIDADHVVAERYGIINVPTAIWIDEDDRIVRPPDMTPVNDLFKDFTGIESEVHHDQLRAWVRDGDLPLSLEAVAEHQNLPTADAQLARLHRRIGAWLHRAGRDDDAARHFDAARSLAPWDWTVHRGSMPLSGRDPFGQEFFDYVKNWSESGSPGYTWGNAALRRDIAST